MPNVPLYHLRGNLPSIINLHLKHSSAFMALHFWILTVFVQIGSHLDSHCHQVMLGVIEGHRAVDPASMQKAMR